MKPRMLPPAMIATLLGACACPLQGISDRLLRPVAQVAEPLGVFRIDGLGPGQKVVALTIDDSPSGRTGEILDLLKERRATATFFVHGSRITPENSHLIRRMLAEGHEIANHMPEPYPSAKLPPAEFEQLFLKNHGILMELGAEPVRFRPSHGFGNRAMREFIRSDKVLELGYRPKFYLGSNFCWDVYGMKPAAYACLVTACARPGRVTVFHDNRDRPDGMGGLIDQTGRTLEGLPVFLDRLHTQGFAARSLAEVEALAAPSSRSIPAP